MWNPQNGVWSEENFDSLSGASGSDLTKQTITGGYVTLVPQVNASSSYLHPWYPVTGWSFTSSLDTQYLVASDFLITGFSGYLSNEPTGYQKVSFAGGAWEVYTELATGSAYSEPLFNAIVLNSGSTDQTFFDSQVPTVTPFTLEFDVASTYQLDPNPLPGFSTGQANLTGLSSLTGWVNHGVYLSSGPYWDFLECRPDGIRSFNHPELAIPINLSQPKRVRVGIDGTNIFILAENNTAVAGVGKFNTMDPLGATIDERPVIAFGAPRVVDNVVEFSWNTNTFSGCVGRSYWDNIKLLTGDLVLDTPTGLDRLYSTTAQNFYTAPFYPGHALKDWSSAYVDFVDYPGGTTTVTPQYESNDQFVDYSIAALVLTGQSPLAMDLSSLPITNYVNNQSGIGRTGQPENAIRFKITQSSVDGTSPSPLVDKITILGSKEEPYLELVPNWKPYHREGRIELQINTGKFYNTPNDKNNDSALFYSPRGLGLVTGEVYDALGNTGQIIGTGQIVSNARWDYSYQNYGMMSGLAQEGSEAAKIFGSSYVTNYIIDPTFSSEFSSLSYTDAWGSGQTVGVFGKGVYLPPQYTGQSAILGIKHRVHRTTPGIQTTAEDYAQRYVVNKTFEKAGIEVQVPEGILSNGTNCLFSFDVKMFAGSGIHVYATGSASASGFYVPVENIVDYSRISVPLSVTNTGKAMIGIVAMTGNTGLSDFVVDNLSLTPYTDSYLRFDNVSGKLHTVGTTNLQVSDYYGIPLVDKASTCLDTFIYLDSYPTGENVLLHKARSSDGRGVKISLNGDGYPVAQVDFSTSSIAGGNILGYTAPVEVSHSTQSFTGLQKVPVGRWSHLGFIHQAHNFREYDQYYVTGMTAPGNLASSNRVFMTINGLPIMSEDCLRAWNTYTSDEHGVSNATGAYPYTVYVSDGNGYLTAASGVSCKLEDIHYCRPPIAEVESYMAMKASRICQPYLLPNIYLHPGTVGYSGYNAYLTGSSTNSPGLITHNVYTLDNPGPYTVWDHGSTKNHLVFYGNVTKDNGNSPYNTGATGYYGSTRFGSAGYGRNFYSSATDRLINDDYAWTGTLLNPSWPADTVGGSAMLAPRFYIGGWVYPRTTGEVLTLAIDDTAPEDRAIVLDVTSTGFRLIDRYSAGTELINLPGSVYTSPLNTWSHVGFYVKADGYAVGPVSPGAGPGIELQLYESGVNSTGTTDPGLESAGFIYKGYSDINVGTENLHSASSALFLGRSSDVSLSDVFLTIGPEDKSKPIFWSGILTGEVKGKGFTLAYHGTGLASGQFISGWNSMSVDMPAVSKPSTSSLWVGTNWYNSDELSHVQGVTLSPRYPFKNVTSYYYRYDPSDLYNAFGGTDSPIRLGYSVPEHAINIARIDTPPFSVEGSISVIDLSDHNSNNLSTYRNGQFTLVKDYASGISGISTGSYKAINQAQYSGMSDLRFYNQLDTDEFKMTSISVASQNIEGAQEAYYAYLLGRGDWAVNVVNAYPHPENGGLSGITGQQVDRFLDNFSKVKDQISVIGTDGKKLTDFPWDIYCSPYSPEHLEQAVKNGQDIYVDGTSTGSYTGILPNGVFSVIMVSTQAPSNGNTVWVNYKGYRLEDGAVEPNRKEIYNPIPIMRQRAPNEFPRAGQFSVSLNKSNEKYFDVTVHGVDRNFTGYF